MHLLKTILVLATTSAAAFAGDSGTTRTPAADIAWGPTPFGPDAATVTGQFAKGAHSTFIRFAAGMATPLHTHTNGYTGVVVSGVSRHYEPGKPETETLLGQGSVWTIPGGVPHVSECLDGETCIFLIAQDAAMDFVATAN